MYTNSHLQALSLHRKACPNPLPTSTTSFPAANELSNNKLDHTLSTTTPSAARYPQSKPQFLLEISLSRATQELRPRAPPITASAGTTNHLSLPFS